MPGITYERPARNIDDTERTGFLNKKADSTISFVDGTRTFSITPTAAEFVFYQIGIKYAKTAQDDLIITDVEGIHLIYYELGVLTDSVNPTDAAIDVIIRTKPWVASIYWDSSAAEGILYDDRHGTVMDGETHEYLHHTNHFVYSTGLGLNTISADGAGDADAHIEWGIDAGVGKDEDLEHALTALTTATARRILRLNGANWEWSENVYGFLTAGTGRAGFNDSGSQTEVTDGDFVLLHIGIGSALDGKVFCVQGQAEYTSNADAADAAETEVNVILAANAFSIEKKIIFSIVIQTDDTYTNTQKSRIVTIPGGGNAVDHRIDPGNPGVATDHGNLGGLLDDDHTQYVLLAGRAGGQEAIGGTAASETLTFESTSHGTKGVIQFKDPVEIRTEKALKFMDDDNTNFISFKSPSTVASDIAFTLPDADSASDGQVLKSDSAGTLSWVSHAGIAALGIDDHTQYLLLIGRAGGQAASGGIAAGEDLTLNSTTHGTKGTIIIGNATNGLLVSELDGTVSIKSENAFKFMDADNSNFISFQSPSVVASDIAFTLPDADATADGQVLKSDSAGTLSWVDHAGISVLNTDDHTQYLLLIGRAGGQTASGGIASGEDLTLNSTTHGTKGTIIIGNATNGLLVSELDGTVSIKSENAFKFMDADNTNFISFQSPSVVASDVAFVLPDADGTSGQVLITNASGVLSWVSHAGIAALGTDDHTQYVLLLGRAGGQDVIGSTDAGENLTFESTSNGSKGVIQCKDPLEIRTEKALKFMDADNSNFVSFKSASVVASDVAFILPDADGTANQVIKTNASAVLDWISVILASSGDINETSFAASNNEAAAVDLTGLAFANGTVRSFRASVSINIDATADLFEHVELMGIQKGASWEITATSVGDATGIVFSITSAGQVQYTSTNISGFVSNTMKFRAWVTTV